MLPMTVTDQLRFSYVTLCAGMSGNNNVAKDYHTLISQALLGARSRKRHACQPLMSNPPLLDYAIRCLYALDV